LNYATPYEVFRELTGIDAIILVKGIRLWVESAYLDLNNTLILNLI